MFSVFTNDVENEMKALNLPKTQICEVRAHFIIQDDICRWFRQKSLTLKKNLSERGRSNQVHKNRCETTG